MKRFTWQILYSLFAMLLLTACTVASIPQQGDAEAEQTAVDIEATIEARIATAVVATVEASDAAVDRSDNVNPTLPPVQESAAAVNVETEPPLLIAPTPDQSAQINEYVRANTRHFRGNPNAPVLLIEFSDFL